MVDTSEAEAAEEVEAEAEAAAGEKMIKMEMMITEVMMTEMMILTVETAEVMETAEEMETTAALMRRMETAPMMRVSYHSLFSLRHIQHYREFNICCQEHSIPG